MAIPSDNESWLIDFDAEVIERESKVGIEALTNKERLVYCLWIADYCMRNAGDLLQAHLLYSDWQSEGSKLAGELGLANTLKLFSLSRSVFEESYSVLFETVCDEIKHV